MYVMRFMHKTCFTALGFKGIFLGFPANLYPDCCCGRRLMVAASDGMIDFSFCRVSAAFYLILLHFGVAGGVDFDLWSCCWARVQSYL